MEYPALISETTFSQNYSSSWRSLAPAGELYIRKINTSLYERFGLHLASTVSSDRRALVNEATFRLFELWSAARSEGEVFATTAENIAAAETAAQIEISRLENSIGLKANPLDVNEKVEIITLFRSLHAFFTTVRPGQLVVSPMFPGCGIVDSCKGDIITNKTLYEIKAGERNFRSTDLRQLLTYAALNVQSGAFDIKMVGLINPRIGIFFEADLEELCFEVAGKAANDLLGEIVEVLSSGGISR